MSTVKELLIEGRARIEQGWCQGQSMVRGAPPSFCMLGAIDSTRIDYVPACIEARLLLTRVVLQKHGINDVIRFNDMLGRTQADVLEVYDMAIGECE